MMNQNDFEQRVSRSIQASIAVKERLLSSAELVSMVARVSKILVNALKQGNSDNASKSKLRMLKMDDLYWSRRENCGWGI